jgi:hypothetical protein
MSFRNRKISDKAAHSIANKIACDRFNADINQADLALSAARTMLENSVKDLVDTCPAYNAWIGIDFAKRQHLEENPGYHNGYEAQWRNTFNAVTKMHNDHGDVEDQERVTVTLDWYYMPKALATGELPMFIGDEEAAKFDVYQWHEDNQSLFSDMPEHVALVALQRAYYTLDADKNKVCGELYAELCDRSTKEVMEAWPETEAFIHDHYDYTGGTLYAPITQPLNMFIDNAMTPAITHQAAE